MAQVEAKNPNEPEFIQAVRNLQRLLFHLLQSKKMMEKIYFRTEPERSIIFRVLGR
jgi:glutamate dehydrogenase (NADP+)